MWIAQISDPHVRPHGRLYNEVMDSNAALAAAVHQINSLSPLPDLVLLTGDVVEHGEPAEYDAARNILKALRPKLLVIPGNHDDHTAFRAAFKDHLYLPGDGALNYAADVAASLRVVALDVTVPGAHHGEADDARLAWLEQTLTSAPEMPTIIMMHQPPLCIGVPYLDKYRCFGSVRLAQVISRFPTIERVLCGHVHRQIQMRFAGTLLCTAPSTATAIALRPFPDALPASFIEPPGFLLHHWRPGGGMLTYTVPIGSFAGPFPFA